MSGAIAALLFLVFTTLIVRKIIEGSEFQCDCFGVSGCSFRSSIIFCWISRSPSLPCSLPGGQQVVRHIHIPLVGCPWRFSCRCSLGPPFLCGSFSLRFGLRPPAPIPEEKKVEMDIAFPVKISKAHRGTLVKGITSSGLLRPERIELVPKVSGEIVAVHAYEGKEVAKGEIVAIIDRTEFRLAYERASFALLAAQIEYRTLSASPFLQTVDTIQARRDLEAARDHFQRVRTAYAAGRIDGPAFIRAKRSMSRPGPISRRTARM